MLVTLGSLIPEELHTPVKQTAESCSAIGFLDKKRGRLSITDHFELSQAGSFESIVIAPADTRQQGNDAIITTEHAHIRIQPSPGTRIRAIEACTYKDHQGKKDTVQRIRLASNQDSASGSLSYTVLID